MEQTPSPSFTHDEARHFIEVLYQQVLGRDPDESGRDHYIQELQSGRSPLNIALGFLQSHEYRARVRRDGVSALSTFWASRDFVLDDPDGDPLATRSIASSELWPRDFAAVGEAGKSYQSRIDSGFFRKYCSGPIVLDIGYRGRENPFDQAVLPHAIGVDTNFPGYNGLVLPFQDSSVDTVFSSHCLQQIQFDRQVIRDWFRVLRTGGFIVCAVPNQFLFEKRRYPPSRFDDGNKHFYSLSSLALAFETALAPNHYRVRHAAENDTHFDYSLDTNEQPFGCYEIEFVVQKITPPSWVVE